MTRRRQIFLLSIVSAFALALRGQSSGLVVQVNPEAYVSPASIQLSFSVNNPGDTVSSQPAAITGWVRALPGQQIRLSALAGSLTGPAGPEPASAIGFAGTMTNATGGAKAASCATGSFSGSSAQPLVAGWGESGIATCTVTFTLSSDAAWPAGLYTARIALSVLSQ
jgi:hypothetical protein